MSVPRPMKLSDIQIPPELVIRGRMTYEQWRAGRRLRRELSDLVSPEECGQDTSDDDSLLRAKYNGRRNSPFTPTQDLPGVSLYDLARRTKS